MPNNVYNSNSMPIQNSKPFSFPNAERDLNKGFHGFAKSANSLETESKIIN